MKKSLGLVGVLLLLGTVLLGQCPTISFFKDRFEAAYQSTTQTTDQRLMALLQLERQMQQCRYESDSVFTILLQKLGVLYYLKSDFRNAVAYTEKSIRNAAAALPVFDSSIVQSYNNLGYYYDSLHEEKKEYDVVDSCIAYAIKKNTGFSDACLALEKKTARLFGLGDYRLCDVSAQLGEGLVKRYYHQNDSINLVNYFVTFQANALYFSYRIPLMEKLLKSREADFIKSHRADQLASIYSSLGRINRDRRDFNQAIVYFKKAYQANIANKYREGISEDLNTLGMLYAKKFRLYDKGLDYCTRALAYADSPADSLIVLQNMANIHSLRGEYDIAQQFFQRAFNTLGIGTNEATRISFNLQDKGFNIYQDILDLITDKGNAFHQQYLTTQDTGWLRAAIAVYRQGDRFLSDLKRALGLQFQSNLVWRMDAHNLYERAIEACWANHDEESAFYFFEKSRAVLLSDQIKTRRLLSNEDIANTTQWDQQIVRIEAELQTTDPLSAAYTDLLKKLYIISESRRAISVESDQKKPASPISSLDTAFLTIGQFRKKILQGDTRSLLEIFTGDSSVYLLTVLQNGQTLDKIDKPAYDGLVRQFLEQIAHPISFVKDFQSFVDASGRLYQLLFADTRIPAGGIIVSPDAAFFPLEALVVDKSGKQPRYFLEDHVTSYTYSAGFLTDSFAVPEQTGARFFGIAPVQFGPHLHLADLQGSDFSLKKIAAYFGEATNLLHGDASKGNFLQHFPEYDIIQLYTHAAESSSRNDPVIYFADSALYLSQLATLRKPQARLVVLSACETANGSLYRGEGVFSFNRSFASLGIPAAISNLWAVDNQSTYQLTELFYKYLARGLAMDIALNQAKLEFIRSSSTTNQYPYFWAAAVLVGKSSILTTHKKNPSFVILLAVVLLIAAGFRLARRYAGSD